MTRLTRRRRQGGLRRGIEVAWITDTHLWFEAFDDPDWPPLAQPNMQFHTGRGKVQHAVAQINAMQPHLAMHTGDVVHGSRNHAGFATFTEAWSTVTAPKAVVPGNHDVTSDRDLGNGIMEGVASLLGYSDRPVIAGSRFNQAVSVEGNGVTARFLFIDSNRNSATGSFDNGGGYCHPDLAAWITNEIVTCPERLVVLVNHYPLDSFYGSDGRTVGADETRFINAVAAGKSATGKTIISLCGHTHSPAFRRDNRVPWMPTYVAPALIDRAVGSWTTLTINAEGDVFATDQTANWPYP